MATNPEQVDSGASATRPEICNNIKIGDYIVIRGRPCKIVEKHKSKTGKHGSGKAHIVALDIFTHKKLEDICPSTSTREVPVVVKEDYQLLDIQEGEYLSIMSNDGETRADLKLPESSLSDRIRRDFEEGKSLLINVIKAMGEEGIFSAKEIIDCY
jgi:translation initiation factor 5A